MNSQPPSHKKNDAPLAERAVTSDSAKKELRLPRHVQEFLACAPRAGEGRMHSWLFHAACVLRKASVPEEGIEALIGCAVEGEGISSCEIEDAVRNSRHAGKSRTPRWPAVSLADRRKVIVTNGGLAQLEAASPDDVSQCTPRRMLKRLFRPDELVCAGTAAWAFITRTRFEWLDKLGAECLLVPSPMTSHVGMTRGGKKSSRSLNNVGARRWIIIKQDTGDLNEQAAILLHLAEFAPLGMVVFSGGKSLHGWFDVQGEADSDVLYFFRHAVVLGADPALWSQNQMTRLPGARRRQTGLLQRAVYVDFGVIKQAKGIAS